MNGDGHWRVPGYSEERELGAGASGRVVLARREHDGAEVAIKYLSDQLRSDVGFVARFRHEARLLGTVRSPHNARLVDYVETGFGAAIVMELVDGVPLRELLRSEGPTGPEAALYVLKGSLQGLAAAHAIGVVHRDFKPENVMVQGDGTSKLVDFGIAVRVGDDANAAGTPPYMAPEQWVGSSATPATDVYAATVVFFECLTGARPFRAPNLAALARQHQSAAPPVEEVPGPLRNLVERGLAKDPDERPESAETFLIELEAVAARAYGSDWEERGKRRLARLAGLLLVLLPGGPEAGVEAQTSLARTDFGEPGLGETTRLMSRLSTKIVIGTACTALVFTVGVVLIQTMSGEPQLQARTTPVTPSATVSVADARTEEPTEEPSSDPPEETATEPATEPTTSASATPPPVASSTPKPSRTPKATRTPRPSRSTSRPVRTTAKASPPPESPGPEITSDVDDAPTVASTTSRPPTTSAPPTVRPTRTLSSPDPTVRPTQTPTNDDGGNTPTLSSTPGPGAVLAIGLMTSGAVPVTLAMKRHMAGRHRRKR
ncbi:serine/threonine-protein kinase [Nonomuraea rhizosphaerae]|uniref:serine/threonine-protein kinase n=1 Tax=Nonomuraea rhizosphaerae TaxID=2665663 RepID=UPI001C5DA977|nr:serine/threonine-protein kinase [Nonomuraea rhizosphaerae]